MTVRTDISYEGIEKIEYLHDFVNEVEDIFKMESKVDDVQTVDIDAIEVSVNASVIEYSLVVAETAAQK